MFSLQSVPRIRVDMPYNSPSGLPSSSTLDIRDILGQAKLLPKLLAEDLVPDEVDDALYSDDGRLQGFPSFPMGRQPPIFILDSHRARLPFPIRLDAFELGDFFPDEEDSRSLLTGPTVPRMKMMMKEQLYVQKWVDALVPDDPPKHIPWTCERPAVKKKWIPEGSIFPVVRVKSDKSLAEQCGATQGHSCVGTFTALIDQAPRSQELCAFPEVSAPVLASTESHTSTPHLCTESADVEPSILRGESKTSHTPHRAARAPQAPSTPTLLPSRSPIGTTSGVLDAPLAARRGKSLSGLRLKGHIIEHLEYPDIPTAFRGSSTVWPPQFDSFLVPSFMDHDSMLLDLKSKCAMLGSGVSAYIQEPLRPQSEWTRTSPSFDEWAFTRELTVLDNDFLKSIDSKADTSVFLPDDSSTPVKGPTSTARFGFVPCLQSAPVPGNRSSDPPAVPLPPRPALVNPSTPPHVRGILKKVKSVRFEDMTTNGSENLSPPVVSPQTLLGRPSSLPLATSERSCTPMPNTSKSSSGPAPLGKNIQKKSAPGSRLPPKRGKASEKLEVAPHVSGALETSQPISSAQRPYRTTHAKGSVNPATVSRAQAKQKASSVIEIDVRRGIEGTAKNRLSAPLRNIFRFR